MTYSRLALQPPEMWLSRRHLDVSGMRVPSPSSGGPAAFRPARMLWATSTEEKPAHRDFQAEPVLWSHRSYSSSVSFSSPNSYTTWTPDASPFLSLFLDILYLCFVAYFSGLGGCLKSVFKLVPRTNPFATQLSIKLKAFESSLINLQKDLQGRRGGWIVISDSTQGLKFKNE